MVLSFMKLRQPIILPFFFFFFLFHSDLLTYPPSHVEGQDHGKFDKFMCTIPFGPYLQGILVDPAIFSKEHK